MKAYELVKSKGLKSKSNRIGRGNASKGNTSGRGNKGQKSRSGFSMKATFEGGQTSIVQRMPKKRGFKRYYKLIDNYNVINIGRLGEDERIQDSMEITKFKLKELGYIKSEKDLVKILGNGDLKKKLNFTDIDSFSKSAKEKIEKAGGKVNE